MKLSDAEGEWRLVQVVAPYGGTTLRIYERVLHKESLYDEYCRVREIAPATDNALKFLLSRIETIEQRLKALEASERD